MAGLTAAGFVAKTYAEILADVETRQKAALGADLDVSPEQPLGQINGIFSAHHREVWELAAAVYAARDPRGASGDALTGLAMVSGSARRGAQRAVAPLAVTLAAGVTLPAGSVAGVAGDPTRQFATDVAVTNTGIAEATLGVRGIQVAAGAVPTGTTVNAIVTPVSGWVRVTLATAIIPGALAETDPVLRRRRDAELQGAGASLVEAIYTRLSAVPLVTEVKIFENTTGATDADGRPPHSIEAIVLNGDAGAVALALWRAKAGGIETYGSTSVVVGDSRGANRTVRFSRPLDRLVFALVIVDVDPQNNPGIPAIKAAVVASMAGLRIGETARRSAVSCALLAMAGMRDVLTVAFGDSATSVGLGNFPVPSRYRAAFDVTRVEVNYVVL